MTLRYDPNKTDSETLLKLANALQKATKRIGSLDLDKDEGIKRHRALLKRTNITFSQAWDLLISRLFEARRLKKRGQLIVDNFPSGKLKSVHETPLCYQGIFNKKKELK